MLEYVDGPDRKWTNRSVIRLMKDHPGETDPESVVRRLSQSVVSEYLDLGWTGPPFCPRQLASFRGIFIERVDRSIVQDTLLRPRSDGRLEILVNEEQPVARQNFSIFHEHGHTLFPDHFERVRHRGADYHVNDPDNELEFLCDIAASELFLPSPFFEGDLKASGSALSSLRSLSQRYEASLEAVARRMVMVTTESVAVVFFAVRLKKTEDSRQTNLFEEFAPQPKLRVRASKCSKTFPRDIFIPRHKSVEADSPIGKSLQGGPDVQGEEFVWTIGDRMHTFRCDVRRLPGGYGEERGAIALLRPC